MPGRREALAGFDLGSPSMDSRGGLLLLAMAVAGGRGTPGDTRADGDDSCGVESPRVPKIPFTCSYLPGKSQIHLVVLGVLCLLWCIVLSVVYEREALADPVLFVPAVIGFAAVWACLRWRTAARARSEEAEVQFEEVATPAIQVLGLNRDGAWPTDRPTAT
jgi:hypothetical protein